MIRPCLTVMMGGAVGTFAALGEPGPQVQALVAQDLGLEPMPVPSRAILDPFAGYVSALAIASASAARVCADIATLMQTEFGEVSEARAGRFHRQLHDAAQAEPEAHL